MSRVPERSAAVALLLPLLAVVLAPVHAIGAWLTWLAVPVLGAFVWSRREELPAVLRNLWPLLALCGWGLISLGWSAERAPLLEPLVLVLLFGVAASVSPLARFRELGVQLLLAGVLLSAVAAMAFGFAAGDLPGQRLEGLGRIDNAVVSGTLWAVGFALALGLLLDRTRPANPGATAAIVFAAVLLAVAAVLSQSRGALLALAATAGVCALTSLRPRTLFVFAAVGLATVALLVLLLPEAFSRVGFAGLERRFMVWELAFERFAAAPFLGHGLGSAEGYVLPDGHYLEHAHSLPLGVAVALGLVGLALYVNLVALAAWSALRVARSQPLALAVLVAGTTASVFDGRLPFTRVDEAWWLLWLPVWLALTVRPQEEAAAARSSNT